MPPRLALPPDRASTPHCADIKSTSPPWPAPRVRPVPTALSSSRTSRCPRRARGAIDIAAEPAGSAGSCAPWVGDPYGQRRAALVTGGGGVVVCLLVILARDGSI